MNDKTFGIIRVWNDPRGFGFVRSVDSLGIVTHYFLHIAQIISGEPEVGAGVHFDIGERKAGAYPPALSAVVGLVVPRHAPASEVR